MENTLHTAGPKDLVEGEEAEENEGEKAACGFLSKDIAPEDQLGIPRDDGLVQIEEDGFRSGLHCREVRPSR